MFRPVKGEPIATIFPLLLSVFLKPRNEFMAIYKLKT